MKEAFDCLILWMIVASCVTLMIALPVQALLEWAVEMRQLSDKAFGKKEAQEKREGAPDGTQQPDA